MASNLLVIIGAGLGIGGAVAAFFWKAEEVVSQEAKDSISKWLRRLDMPKSLSDWPSQFVALFDRMFGRRHWSWRCFIRSMLASWAAVGIMLVVWLTVRPCEFLAFIGRHSL